MSLPASDAIPNSGDERVVALAKQGDSRAWGEIFDRYYPLLYRYARARLSSAEDAEDIAAEAFLSAFKAINRYEDRGQTILAWLYAITRNLVSKRAQQMSKENRISLASDFPSVDEHETLERLDLLAGLRALKDEQRDVVILRLTLGMSIKETAEIMGKTEAAIHSLQVRAISNLRKAVRR